MAEADLERRNSNRFLAPLMHTVHRALRTIDQKTRNKMSILRLPRSWILERGPDNRAIYSPVILRHSKSGISLPKNRYA